MKKLLVLGAGFLQKFVIQKAVELGYYVYAVDKNPDSVAFPYADESAVVDIIDKHACLEFARKKEVDGVMTAATDYGVLSASYVAEKMGLFGINEKSAQIIKNKYLVRKVLSLKNIDCVKQFYEVSSESDIDALKERVRYPLMVKPCDGSGSKATVRVDSFDELKRACVEAMRLSLIKRAVCEDFIVGREYGVETLVLDGEAHIMAVMQKDMTQPPYYAELGHSVPSGLASEIKVRETVCNAIKALGVNFGAVNMDVLVTDSGEVCIVDIGARMGGNLIGSHIVPASSGIDYLGNLIRATVGDAVDLSVSERKSAVATRILALKEGRVKALPDFEAIEKKYAVEICHHLSVGDEIRQYKNNLDGCGYIIARAEDVQTAKNNAYSALCELDLKIVRE